MTIYHFRCAVSLRLLPQVLGMSGVTYRGPDLISSQQVTVVELHAGEG